MRFEKLELTLINAYFVATFDYELSDKKGRAIVGQIPAVDQNAHAAQKSEQAIFLRYKPRRQ
jgi:hypothetical protein